MAEVAGPGAYSKRTDLGYTGTQPMQKITGGGYGEMSALNAIQGGAAMSASGEYPAAAAAAVAMPTRQLGGPTARPTEPVTHGADFGPGAGSEVLPIPPQGQDETAMTIRALATVYPNDPDLNRLLSQINAEGR